MANMDQSVMESSSPEPSTQGSIFLMDRLSWNHDCHPLLPMFTCRFGSASSVTTWPSFVPAVITRKKSLSSMLDSTDRSPNAPYDRFLDNFGNCGCFRTAA